MQLHWTKQLPLTKSGIAKIKDGVAGIYRLIYYNTQEEKHLIYYVGQAENLNIRLGQHLSEAETNECCQSYINNYNCYFRAAAVLQQTDRNGAEVELYHHFEPICIDQIPSVQPLEINFE